MKTLIILMLLLSLGACKKSKDSGASKNPTPPPNNPTPPPNNPTPEPPEPPPTINEITSVQKIYRSGSEVEFVVTFSKAVEVGQTPFLSLSVGSETRQAHFRRGAGESDKDISFFYEVQSNDNDDDGITLASHEINLNGGSIRDTSGQDLVNTIPEKYQNFPNVKVDALHPTISEVQALNIDPVVDTIVSKNETVDLEATFSEPVKITGSPSLALSVGGSSARAIYQPGGGQSVRVTHTFRYTAQDWEEGSIQVTGMVGEDSNFISDEAGNKTEENIPSPLSVSGITVYTPLCSRSVQSTGFNGGDGSESSPYMICTYTQLDKMRDDLTAHYELVQDIDASESWGVGDDGCTAYDGSTVPTTTPCTGWVPVGSYEFNKCDGKTDDVCFEGHLDGGEHIISNLYLNTSDSDTKYSGLFGYTGGQSEISHIGLTNVSVTVTPSASNSYGGGLVGGNNGTISNSYATGEVTSSTSTDASHSYVGGLVGYNNYGTISNSYATGEVTTTASADASYSYGGGLVGRSSGGTISNSYATGEVTSSASHTSYGGGLVGRSSGTISNSYATGGVTSSASYTSYGGGLVGRSSGGTISNSYATGEVTFPSSNLYGGGLVGYYDSGTISNSYATGTVSSTSTGSTVYKGGLLGYKYSGTISGTNYFVHNSGGTDGIGSGSCSGTCEQKTLAELQALTSVTNWSTDNWDFGTTTQIPRLKYAPTATYCSDNTYTTQETCEDASESWVIEGCGGDTGVTCGDVIPGQ